MFEVGVEELHKLLLAGRAASRYAIAHYDQLAARQCAHTLYGPECHALGASVPSSLTPVRARTLLSKTRRKNHVIYELDDSYDVIRTVHMLDYSNVDCTYHHFDLYGVRYAYPFRGNGNQMYNDEIAALKYVDGKPFYYALISRNLMFVQFYEYTGEDRMMVSTYRYWPTAERSQYGYPIDRNAPIGAPNSCVQRHCRDENYMPIDFSKWLEQNVSK